MTEKDLKGLKFGEVLETGNGFKYKRTVGGWIYSNYCGTAFCFIPDTESKAEGKAETKEKKTDKK